MLEERDKLFYIAGGGNYLKYRVYLERTGLPPLYSYMEVTEIQKTVLIVEDEALIRTCSVSTLQDAGYRVVEAGNSAEALAILARPNVISIMMTDVQMPGAMNGLALTTRVLQDRPDIRSIVVSGTTSAQQASDAGAFGMISKPYLAQTLVDAVHDTILRS